MPEFWKPETVVESLPSIFPSVSCWRRLVSWTPAHRLLDMDASVFPELHEGKSQVLRPHIAMGTRAEETS